MLKLKPHLRLFLGALGAIVAAVVSVGLFTLEYIGHFSVLVWIIQTLSPGHPAMIDWLIATPWWVPTIVLILGSALSTWLIVTGVRSLVAQQKLDIYLPDGTITAKQAEKLLNWSVEFRADWDNMKSSLSTETDRTVATLDGIITRVDNSLKDYAYSQTRQFATTLESAEGNINLAASSVGRTMEQALGDWESALPERVSELSREVRDLMVRIENLAIDVREISTRLQREEASRLDS